MKWTRRDVLKGLGSLPIAGGIWWAGASNSLMSSKERSELLEQLNIDPSLPSALPSIGGEPIKVGIVGFGIRGEQLCRSLGFATKEWLENMEKAAEENTQHTALEDFLDQEELAFWRQAVSEAIEQRNGQKMPGSDVKVGEDDGINEDSEYYNNFYFIIIYY